MSKMMRMKHNRVLKATVLAFVIAVFATGCANQSNTTAPQETIESDISEVENGAAKSNAALFEEVCPGSGHIGIVLANDFGFNEITSVEMCICTNETEQQYDAVIRLSDGKSYHIITTHGNVARIEEI